MWVGIISFTIPITHICYTDSIPNLVKRKVIVSGEKLKCSKADDDEQPRGAISHE